MVEVVSFKHSSGEQNNQEGRDSATVVILLDKKPQQLWDW